MWRAPNTSSEFAAELTEAEMVTALVNQTKRGAIPKTRSTTVAHHDFITVRGTKEFRNTVTEFGHRQPHRHPAMRGAHVVGGSSTECFESFGPDFRRSAPEPAVDREQVGGNVDVWNGHGTNLDSKTDGFGAYFCGSSNRISAHTQRHLASLRGMSIDRISTRVSAIAPSATLAVSNKAKALRAAGEPVIGFGAGEPDFATPEHIVEAAIAACRNPRMHKYSPVGGLPELKEAIAAKTMRDSGLPCSAADVLVTNGGKHAVYNAFEALLNPGDEVLLPTPYWTTYPEPIALAGGVTVPVLTEAIDGFRASLEQLEAARTEQTKALVFVSPSNPTGAVYPREEIEAIGRWAVEHGLWVITDEIYEHLVYGDNEHHSIPVVVPELRDRCIVLNGVAKTYAMTGWRVGWMIGRPDVIKAAQNLQSHCTSNVANVCQAAALAAVSGPLDAVERMREAFDRRRKAMYALLSGIDGVLCPEPQGAFYAYPDLTGVLGRNYGGVTPTTTIELAELMLEQIKVAIVPGEAFGVAGGARLSFALGDDDLGEGVGRIVDYLNG